MNEYLAHSAKGDFPAQTYEEHINGVCSRATQYADEVEGYAPKSKGKLKSILEISSLLHDLGKLDDDNQNVLHDTTDNHKPLPVNHVDAGSAELKRLGNCYSLLAVYSHHRGLPDIGAEMVRNRTAFRDENTETVKHTDETLCELLRRHNQIFTDCNIKKEPEYKGDKLVFSRMLLSCLADADHTDTAAAYGQMPKKEILPELKPKERLALLDKYVDNLSDSNERNRLRREMYNTCRNAKTNSCFTTCDSPVGSGKTTAVMAHLLQQAITHEKRRIFVVLPYTSIIQQSVDVYRKALVLPGENPEEVVAELHCRADFQELDTRYLTSLWRAPIVITTAVAFFETLASNRPSTLRRLHELPGSVVFVDEAHNALPLKLLPIAWRWMNCLAEEWGCYWVLASGSLVRYWELKSLSEIEIKQPNVSELVDNDLRERLMKYERNRITFCNRDKPISRKELVKWLQSVPGPRLLILNTVKNAAVIADDISNEYGRESVEHLSTALTPEDRDSVINRIKKRLGNAEDTNWTLVATSCVEAGVDFSFRTGFRELSSLLSLLQSAGRVNRNGNFHNAQMWSFSLQDDSMLDKNPTIETSREVLKKYFNKGTTITPQLSTDSMDKEISQNDSCIKRINHLIDLENKRQFTSMEKEFNVIDSDTILAVVDESLAESITHGKCSWQMLQRKSVSIRRYKAENWKMKEISSGLYQWTLEYDSFLGYMRGVLNIERLQNENLTI